MGDYVYILEMLVQTIEGMVNEPIGVYTTEEEASKWLKEAQDVFKGDTVVINILPVQVDSRPPILEMTKSIMDKGLAYQIIELYDKDVFDQMVEEDGTFTYQLKAKHQKTLEVAMSKKFRRGNQ